MNHLADYGAIFGDDMDDTAEIVGDVDYIEDDEEHDDESDTEEDEPIQGNNIPSEKSMTNQRAKPSAPVFGHPSTNQSARSCPSPPWGRKVPKSKTTRLSKPLASRRKPLTTNEKIEAALEAKNNPDKNTNKYVQRAKKVPKVTKTKSKKKQPSVLDLMALQDDCYSKIRPLNAKSEESVLNRPTERTKALKITMEKMRQSHYSNNGDTSEATHVHPAELPMGKGSPFKKLEKKTRLQIWTYCVIHSGSFIRPTSNTGAEQPDLAMTCRQIREEVIPIYYGCNEFAIDIKPVSESASSAGICRLKAINKWMKAMEEGGQFSKIRNWVFCYAPEPLTTIVDRSMVGGDEKSAFVAVSFERENSSWKASAVEVHRDARCLTSPGAGRGNCMLKKQPDWLNNAVVDLLHKAGRVSISPNAIQMVANSIAENATELSTARCERVLQSIELD